MFKCSECGQCYQSKPEYCDCGNNEFIETGTPVAAQTSNLSPMNINKKEILSWGILAFCIIISLFIWIFAWNEQPENTPQTKSDTSLKKTTIPDIDQIWKDTSPTKVEQKKNEQPVIPEPKVIKIIERVTVPASAPQPTKKTEQKPKIEKPKNTSTTPKATKPPIPAKNQVSVSNEELNNYKIALRSALFSHLKVTNVKGSGLCEVSFSIDANGQLKNRNFKKLSDNKTMNDAVYYMFMSLPQYYPPPKSYKGETLTMSFYINDGYYEINYK